MLKRAKGGVTGMPPKAYRWVKESTCSFCTHLNLSSHLQIISYFENLASSLIHVIFHLLISVFSVEEISQTHSEEGLFSSATKSEDPEVASSTLGIFHEIAELYRAVAEDTVLGEEKTERRKRGLDVEDVAAAMGEGLKSKRAKEE